jgi:hypothetical protein
MLVAMAGYTPDLMEDNHFVRKQQKHSTPKERQQKSIWFVSFVNSDV